ncbi:MAG: S8 family serine peptidase, partial [Planctomycetes bacterium]|nr:S8 family serine peptidase [Planctomycetota bacterium]
MRTSLARLSLLLSSTFAAASLALAQDNGDAPRVSNDPRVLLRYATFDPVAGQPEVPAQLRATADSHLWIVQFVGTPTDADRAPILAAGAKIHGYLPHDSHIVRMDHATRALVATMKNVRWVGAYEPAYRLEAELLAEHLTGQPVPVRKYNMVMADKRNDKKALEAKIVAMGGKVVDRHERGLLFTAELTGAQLLAAARLDEVLWIDRWTAPGEDMDNARIVQGSNAIEAAAGYTGSGVRGHVYEGVEFNHPDFTTAMTNVRSSGASQAHGHCTAGCIFGNGTSAPQARGHAPDAVGFYTNYSTVTAGWSRNMVIDDVVNVHNCMFTTASWGGAQTPNYTSVSADADDIVFDHRIPWTNSMSNLGNQNVRPEAWAKNVISIGGLSHGNDANPANDTWTSASIGPAADGRLKPDLCNFYDNVWTSDLTGAAGYSAGNSTTGFNGTSSATPITAGLNALAIQMYTDHILNNTPRVLGGTRFQNRPYAQTLKALQIACASLYPVAQASRAEAGWGYGNVATIYDRRSRLTIIPEDVPITQGATHTYSIQVAPGETQLKICMTYLDPAGVVAAAIDRVNDLSLTVTSPGGTIYRGNNGLTANNTSTSGGVNNTIDTVENVFLNNPVAGTWTVTITAPTVTTDAHIATAATDATYALVVNGGTRLYGSGCARYVPDTSLTGTENYFPWGGYAPTTLATVYANNNGGSVGGAVYYNVTVTNSMWVTALDVNTAATLGTELLLDVWRTNAGGTHIGNETNAAAWLPMSAGKGIAAGVDLPSRIDLATPFYLTPGTYGFAVVASNFAHEYTNGTGANQNYSDANLAIACGSATNVPFTGGVNTPRVANTTLRYRLDGAQGTNMRYQTILRQGELATAGNITGLAFSAATTGRHWNSSLVVRMSHVPAGHVMSSTFATNLPAPVTVLSQSNYSFEQVADQWREIGLQAPFAYNGTSDVVIDIVARGNWQTTTGGYNRAGSEPRVYDAIW